MISYQIRPADVAAHRYAVTLTVPQPQGLVRLSLPVWIPGSYLVREFARHLSGMSARQGQNPVALRQIDKATWEADCAGKGALVLSYEVYAFDASVRTAYLDDSRGFFNPTSLCLRVHGREQQPHQIRLAGLPKGWEVATAMASDGKLSWRSAHYDELVDHPFELGAFWRGEFKAGGVVHEFVVAGAWPSFDGERLLADTQRICATQIAFWHGRKKPPFERYVFMLYAPEDGYGGLEHRASTALIANRRDLPRRGQKAASDGYVTLLGLISHEYFHTWNVKRLKPKSFETYDYTQENYTELLWFFEGFTSYYDDLLLHRAGLIDAPQYLKLLGKTVNAVLTSPGRAVQSVAEASFDAWVKYYRSDENTPNATISYYTKGALVALMLDLALRRDHGQSLDALMRALWQRSGGSGITEADILAEVQALGDAALAVRLQQWVHSRDELALAEALAGVGVQWRREASRLAAAWGLKLSEGPVSGVQVKSVLQGSVAAQAGLSAGDELLAVDGWRVRRLEDAQQWLQPGQPCELTVVRQQRLRQVRLQPDARHALAQTVQLGMDTAAPAPAVALRQAWLKL